MRRTLSLLLLASLAVPVSAHADPAKDECETVTTTTVRCTGAAAPLALPAQPPVAVPPPAPSVAPVPQADDEEVPRGPRVRLPAPAAGCDAYRGCGEPSEPVLVPVLRLAGGWQLTLDEHGAPIYQRKKHSANAAVWGPGLLVWLGSWAGAIIGGVQSDNPYAAVPVFGALGTGIGYGLGDGDVGRALGYTASGLFQVGGLVTFIVGVAAGHERIERLPVKITPLALTGGSGMAISGRF